MNVKFEIKFLGEISETCVPNIYTTITFKTY